ncbi:transposase [Legionella drozanskii]
MSKNIYTKEFKLRAIELLEQSSKPIRQIAKELGIGEQSL